MKVLFIVLFVLVILIFKYGEKYVMPIYTFDSEWLKTRNDKRVDTVFNTNNNTNPNLSRW